MNRGASLHGRPRLAEGNIMEQGKYVHGLGARLRALRLFTGMSHEEMARELSVSTRSWQAFETNHRDVPSGVLDDIEEILSTLDHWYGVASEMSELYIDQAPDGFPLPLSAWQSTVAAVVVDPTVQVDVLYARD